MDSSRHDAGSTDAPAVRTHDYKVAFTVPGLDDGIHVWHSRDGSSERLGSYSGDVRSYGYDGQLLLAQRFQESIDILDTNGTVTMTIPAPPQMPHIRYATPRPDFKRFVLAAVSPSSAPAETATLDINGTYNAIGADEWTEYSPDGYTLVGGSNDRIGLMRDDGSQREMLTQPEQICGAPSFSFDGKRIVYNCYTFDGNKSDIEIMDLDTRIVTIALPASFDRAAWPHFTPDGNAIVFVGLHSVSLAKLDLATNAITSLAVVGSAYWPQPRITVALDE